MATWLDQLMHGPATPTLRILGPDGDSSASASARVRQPLMRNALAEEFNNLSPTLKAYARSLSDNEKKVLRRMARRGASKASLRAMFLKQYKKGLA